jgi:hypothetical protein
MEKTICDLDYEECKSTVESNIDIIDHTCKLNRTPKHCAHYCFKKKQQRPEEDYKL